MTDDLAKTEMCIECGVIFPRVMVKVQHGPFCHVEPKRTCDRCSFTLADNQVRLRQQPYKPPKLRLGKDGSIPRVFLDRLRAIEVQPGELPHGVEDQAN